MKTRGLWSDALDLLASHLDDTVFMVVAFAAAYFL